MKSQISQIWTPFSPPFLHYWSDLTEIFAQYVKSKKKHFLFRKFFPFRAWFFIYIQIYINIYIHKRIELPQFLW